VKQGRLNLRLPADLVIDIKELAKRRRVSVTEIVEKYFRMLLEADAMEQSKEDEAEQI